MDNRAMELTFARMANEFLPYSIDQRLLLAPDMRDWLPEGHWALFVDDLVEQLDLNAIYAVYQSADDRGRRGYHPAMMVKLLVYGYCVGKPSSRKIERATYEEVAFRVLSGDQQGQARRRLPKPRLEAQCAGPCRVPPYNHLRHGELERSGRAPLEH
jgi:transposase